MGDISPIRMHEFLHDEDVACLLKVGVDALRNKVLAGDPLPPRSEPPGMRVRLWPRRAVEEWVLQFVTPSSNAMGNGSAERKAKRRGRPSKFSRGQS